MRRLPLSLCLLLGCASAPRGPVAARGWWEGVWVLDAARLKADARASGLDPAAAAVADRLVVGVAPDLRLELADGFLRRRLGGREVAQAVRARPTERGVSLRTAEGETLHLIRDDGGVRLDGLPLRRP